MNREVAVRQSELDKVAQKLLDLEQQTRRIERQLGACDDALRKYRTSISSELSDEYRQQLNACHEDVRKFEKRRSELSERSVSYAKTISDYLDNSRKNRELAKSSEQEEHRRTGLIKDAELISLRIREEAKRD